MKTHPAEPRCYEFYFPELDTLVQVENRPFDVIIRATRNTFSERRKRFFIRELAAEGFIPDDYRWLSLAGSELSRGVRWFVDISWLQPNAEAAAIARRFIIRLFCSTSVLWVGLMAWLFLRSAG